MEHVVINKKYLAVLIMLIVAVILLAVSSTMKSPVTSKITKVNIVKPSRMDVPKVINVVGSILPNQLVEINSRIEGQLEKIFFKDGDYVNENQDLFKIDDASINALIAQQQSTLDKNLAQLDYLKSQLDRAEKIYKAGYKTTDEYENLKSSHSAMKAQIDGDKAALENLNIQKGYTLIKAPISGRAGTINITVGNNVKENDTNPLVTIKQIDPIKAKFSFAQKYYDELRENSKDAKLKVIAIKPDSNEKIEGELSYFENTLDENINLSAIAIFNNKEEKLWPGMFVELQVMLSIDKNVIVIPEEDIHTKPDGSKYVLISVDSFVKVLPVTVKRIQDDNAIVEGDIDENTLVISTTNRISEGDKIDILSEDGKS